MKGELLLLDNQPEFTNKIDLGMTTQDFGINVFVDGETPLEEELADKEEFYETMSMYEDFIDDDFINEQRSKEIEYIKENFDNIMDHIEYVRFAFDDLDVHEYIKKNPILLTKKLVLNEYISIDDFDRLSELVEEYSDYKDQLYIALSGNTNYISLNDCYKTMYAIKKQADDIRSLGLSPMEEIMYAYDKVRSRVYKYEDEGDKAYKSRDLTEVMFGDSIVCLGYANIFNKILNFLGIRNSVVFLKDANDEDLHGHARNIAYINDPKYDIDGVYYFDPTWDSKKNEQSNEYLSSYRFFAKTKNYMDEKDISNLQDEYISEYSPDMIENIFDAIENKKLMDFMKYLPTVNHMSELVFGKTLISLANDMPSAVMEKLDKEETLKKLTQAYNKFNKEIPAETMIVLLNNVRKIEYYQNPELYPYTINDIAKTFLRSGWKFEREYLDGMQKMLLYVFREKVELKPIENFENFGYENDIFEEINQVRLTKVLRLGYEKKNK